MATSGLELTRIGGALSGVGIKLNITAKLKNHNPGKTNLRNRFAVAYPIASTAETVIKPKYVEKNIAAGPSMNNLFNRALR